MSDLSRLHVLPPDTLTRVTEYVPEIVDFVEKIVKNGFGYEADGSVYFDTMAFEGAKGKGTEEWKHTYAKLQPWSKDNEGLREDGEGSLFVSVLIS
jgi:cysteinyl-tRNA synthetase